MKLEISLTEQEAALVRSYARAHRMSVSEAFVSALLEKIEEEEDRKAAQEAQEAWKQDSCLSFPIETLWQELGL